MNSHRFFQVFGEKKIGLSQILFRQWSSTVGDPWSSIRFTYNSSPSLGYIWQRQNSDIRRETIWYDYCDQFSWTRTNYSTKTCYGTGKIDLIFSEVKYQKVLTMTAKYSGIFRSELPHILNISTKHTVSWMHLKLIPSFIHSNLSLSDNKKLGLLAVQDPSVSLVRYLDQIKFNSFITVEFRKIENFQTSKIQTLRPNISVVDKAK